MSAIDLTPGRKVRCVDLSNFRDPRYMGADGVTVHRVVVPTLDAVYTLRDVELDCWDEAGVRLDEIVNPIGVSRLYGVIEPTYRASRFVPIDDRDTDISALEKLLKPNIVVVDSLCTLEDVR